MKKFLPAVAAALASTLPAQAEVALNDQKDKVSYSIGVDIGQTLKRQEIDINPDLLAAGLRDAISGAKPQLTEDEMRQTMQAFSSEMQGKATQRQKDLGEKNKAEGEKFLAENKTKEGVQTTASGLQYKVLKEGKGEKPKATDKVSVNYRGTLINGTEFDASEKHGGPAEFPVNAVIPGWTEALQLMPEGSKWQLYIPASLAYGENGPPGIGPNSTLLFDVELLDVKKGDEAAGEASPSPAAKGKKK